MSENSSPIRKLLNLIPFVGESAPVVSVIELHGAIGVSAGPGRRSLSYAKLAKTIEAAFKPSDLSAVALSINSPGGSPVQSRMIHNAIRRHAEKKKVPVYAFVEDVGASGGYILALAGDEIYADESSIVGSIGVISGGFGFVDAIEKLGVERRVHTAGENKSTLDPFKPEDPKEVTRLEGMLSELHEQFIALVRLRRPNKELDDPELFTGAFWSGTKAETLGLVDGIALLDDFVHARFGKDVKVKTVSSEGGSLIRRLLSDASIGPSSLIRADDVVDALQERALWARFGL